ncbi:YlxR family protein [Falsarthrobacter nasiphocae]|uniref:YlxR family protein n=1 Tax=Falsarthrobacter nasiphocae TaxID=189863 RepID=UPI003898DE2F
MDKPSERPARSRTAPQRTCIGCRAVVDVSELVRLALAPRSAGAPSEIVIDESRSLPGRGAWIHRDPRCAALAVKRKAASRAFREGVNHAPLSEWLAASEHLTRNPA